MDDPPKQIQPIDLRPQAARSSHSVPDNPVTDPYAQQAQYSPTTQKHYPGHPITTNPPSPKQWASGFRRVRTIRDLQPRVDSSSVNRRVTADGIYLSPLRQLTTDLVETYRICNPQFGYESTRNPRRSLTAPNDPIHNDGYDNEDHDYILYTNDCLGTEEGHKYLVLDILGQGTFGQAVKCQNMKTGEIAAVKVIKNNPAYFNQGRMEAKVLELLNKDFDPHDEHHIMRIHDSFTHRNHLCLVFELLFAHLHEVIRQNQFQGLSIPLIKVFMAQIIDALVVLKDARLIHCDIKPENILLKSQVWGDSPFIKVIDFGSACQESETVQTYIQSRFYRSPEVLLGLPCTSAIDMWSLGCTAVELFIGFPLFPGTSEYNQLTRIIDMLGMPPLSMLNAGEQVSQFFDSYEVWNPHTNQNEKRYELKSMEQYSREYGTNEQPGKQHFKATTLPEIINSAPIPQVKSSRGSGNRLEKEMADRAVFVDFCQGLLNLNPVTRWTPQQARMHPFITGEVFKRPFVPRDRPAVTTRYHPAPPNIPDPRQHPPSGTQEPPSSVPYQNAPDINIGRHQQHQFIPHAQSGGQNANEALPLHNALGLSTDSTGPAPVRGPYTGSSVNQVHIHPGSGSRDAPGSYYPKPQALSDQADLLPPALARLQHTNRNVFTGRNVLTPVLNRDSAMREWERRQQNRRPAQAYLRQHAFTTAELHSAERFPPSQCHPGTRTELRGEIHAWLTDENREHDMLWLFGPAGVGKSAIAQTFGELAEKLGMFGAAIFFSRGRKVDNPSLFVTSIAYQLAVRHPQYENLVAYAIERNRAILTDVDKGTQLRKLLIEPFTALKHGNRHFSKELIIIDGLDECGGEAEQLHLARIITEAVEDFDSPPFLWLICSRPEHHLKEFFLDGRLSDICRGRDLLPQEPGADADVERYLLDGLRRITENYRDQHDVGAGLSLTQGSETLSQLVRTVSGVFIVASLILAFVGDPVIAQPASQLQIILNAIDGSAADGSSQNFLAAIDALYLGVLRVLEKDRLTQALRILGTCAVSPRIPALHLANLLNITQDVFYSSLRSLHAFLSVPHHTSAVQESLHFFHASFPDFLLHRTRSGEYFQDPDTHRFRLVEACFYALNSTSATYTDNLSWLPSDPNQDEDDTTLSESPLSISYDTLSLAAMHTWDLCMGISKPQEWKPLLKTLASFDFRHLQPFSDVLPVTSFIRFIRWTYMLGKEVLDLRHIFRTHCDFRVDRTLLEKCSTISRPLNLESIEETGELKTPRYVFAGLGAMTVIILLIPEAVVIYSIEDIDSL